MIKTRSSIVINRPLPEVWDFLMDLDSMTLWQPGVGNIQASNKLHKGSQVEATFDIMGKQHRTVAEVVENNEHSMYKVRSMQGPITYLVTYQLTEEDQGTRLTIDSEGEMGTLLKMAEPVIKYMSETRREANLKVLKKILESRVSQATV